MFCSDNDYFFKKIILNPRAANCKSKQLPGGREWRKEGEKKSLNLFVLSGIKFFFRLENCLNEILHSLNNIHPMLATILLSASERSTLSGFHMKENMLYLSFRA